MGKSVHCHVTTSALVVTTITVPVIKGVKRAGRETTVKNVLHFFNVHYEYFLTRHVYYPVLKIL